jgi:hypothetical protein
LSQESKHGWFQLGKAEERSAFRLNHPAQKFDADKVYLVRIGLLFVSIGASERIASKGQW